MNFAQTLKTSFIPTKENNYRPRFLESRVLIYFVAVLLLLKLFTLPFFLFFSKNIFFASIVESSLVQLVNNQRQSLGIEPLNENPQLKQAALLKAEDMAEKGYFAHQSPEGLSPWHWFSMAGYNYQVAGENLAIGFLDSDQVHQAWLASPSHRANLINSSYREIGIAVVQGNFQGRETAIVVQLFGKPTEFLAQAPAEETPGLPTAENLEAEKPEIAGAETSAPEVKNNLIAGFLSFVASDFYNFLQKFIYGFLFLIIASLILNVFVRFDIQRPDLILKTAFFICLLIVFLLLDKVDMVNIISRGFAI